MKTPSIYLFFLVLLGSVQGQYHLCPSFCTCLDRTMDCKNGYLIDTETLSLMPNHFSTIKIHHFTIRSINTLHLQRFRQLRELAITDCDMRAVDGNSFSQHPFLQSVDFSQNQLSELSPDLFIKQSNLSHVSLSDNLVEHLPENLFQNNPKLHTLNLSNNRIWLVPPGIFEGLTNLEYLDLSHNEISYILPHTFSYISVVRYIDLSNNLLVTLHEDLFDSNNVTVETKLSVVSNPLDCNCGLMWLKEAIDGNLAHLDLLNVSSMICVNPRIYQHQKLKDVPLGQLNCTPPTASVSDMSSTLFHKSKVKLKCDVSGSPNPSIVWKTPMSDYISDPYQGEWIDGSISSTSAEKKYQIYATGEIIHFTVESFPKYSVLSVDSLHLVSSGLYQCIALSPGGNATSEHSVTMVSSVQPHFYPSLVVGAFTVLIAICLGVVGCSVTACIEKCTGCKSMSIKYYDGSWMNCDNRETTNNNADEEGDDCSIVEGYCSSSSSSDEEADEEDDLLGAAAGADGDEEAYALAQFCQSEINEHTALTAEVWDAYFREYPDDFIVESFDESPKKFGSPQHSQRGSPTHRSHGRTLETLEGVRVRLKLRVEQIDVMKERLRIHMEKRSARMKETMEKRKERMNKKMQTIKESTSQSLQSIRETGRTYSHKLHMGVRTAMENVGAQVQSLKEFCGTGDLGQTLSIATITTDIDTNEKTQLTRSVTMV